MSQRQIERGTDDCLKLTPAVTLSLVELLTLYTLSLKTGQIFYELTIHGYTRVIPQTEKTELCANSRPDLLQDFTDFTSMLE